jgi:hypothetical protein
VLAGTTTTDEVSSAVTVAISEAVAEATEKASSDELLVSEAVLSDRPGMVYIRPSMSVVYGESDSVNVRTWPFARVI